MYFVLKKKREPGLLEGEHMFRLPRSLKVSRDGVEVILKQASGKSLYVCASLKGKANAVVSEPFYFSEIPPPFLATQDLFLKDLVQHICEQVKRYTLDSGVGFERGALAALAAYKGKLSWRWDDKNASLHISNISNEEEA